MCIYGDSMDVHWHGSDTSVYFNAVNGLICKLRVICSCVVCKSAGGVVGRFLIKKRSNKES